MYKAIGSAAACTSSVQDCLRDLGADDQRGLSASEASSRLAFHGPNELNASEPETIYAKFLEKLREPMIALLLASAGVSILTGQYDDAISITLVSYMSFALY